MRFLSGSTFIAALAIATRLCAATQWGGEVGVTTNYYTTPYYEGGDYNPDYYSNPNGTVYYYSCLLYTSPSPRD